MLGDAPTLREEVCESGASGLKDSVVLGVGEDVKVVPQEEAPEAVGDSEATGVTEAVTVALGVGESVPVGVGGSVTLEE